MKIAYIEAFMEQDKFNWENTTPSQDEINSRNNLIKNYCASLNNLEDRAYAFASMAHNGIYRKFATGIEKTPYIVHPIRVAEKVKTVPDHTTEMIQAAYLHDTVEDCYVPLSLIEELFGTVVSSIVWDLTERFKKAVDEHGKLLPRAQRQAMEANRLSQIKKQSKIIKLCDRLDNLPDMPKGKFLNKYLPESLDVLKAVGDGNEKLAGELAKLISSLS